MVEIAVFHYTGLTLSKNIKLYNIICFNSLPNNPETRQQLTHSSVKYIIYISQVLGERFEVLCPIAMIRNSHLSLFLSLGDQTHNSRTMHSIPKLLSYV